MLRLPSCPCHAAPTILPLPSCVFHPTPTILHIPSCACHPAPTILRLPSYPYHAAPTILRLPSCPYHPAHSILPLPSCACHLGPTILRLLSCPFHPVPPGSFPSSTSMIFHIIFELWWEKYENKRREAGIGPFLKSLGYSRHLWPISYTIYACNLRVYSHNTYRQFSSQVQL